MDWARIHIMISHVPIVLVTVGTVSALLGLVTRRRGLWLYGSVSLTLAAVAVVPTYFTGGPTQRFLHRPWYITSGAMQAHEDAATLSALLVVIAGAAALVAWRRLVRYPREVVLPPWLRAAVLVTALAGAASILYTGLLGEGFLHDSPVLQHAAPASLPAPARSALPNG